MARPLRIQFEGALYHVMNRGIDHQDIFLNDSHREIFLSLLEEISIKFNAEIICYCLMSNHYHLLIRTPIPNLSKIMRHLDGLYTRKFNITQRRDGSIFRGRYKAILIEEESYLLQVSRYIHLNPVEAKISKYAIDYPWSSYRAFINEKIKPNWLKTDLILFYFNHYKSYEDFVAQGVDEKIKNFYNNSSSILGEDEFVEKHLSSLTDSQKTHSSPDIKKTAKLPTIQEISKTIVIYFSIHHDDLIVSSRGRNNLARSIAIFLARRLGQCSHLEIANYFRNISSASLSTAIRRIEEKILSDPENKRHLNKIIEICLNKNLINDVT